MKEYVFLHSKSFIYDWKDNPSLQTQVNRHAAARFELHSWTASDHGNGYKAVMVRETEVNQK